MYNTTRLQVHAYDWVIKDKFGDDDQTVIDCWALDNESNPYLLIINNFPVFCFIELPFFNNNRREIRWTMDNAKVIVTKINTLLHADGKILKSELLDCQKLYYYQGDRKTKFLRVYFNNVQAMRNCRYKLDNAIYTEMGLMKFDMHEYDIDIVRKLLSLKNVKYSGWFEVDARLVEEELKISTLPREYRINWTTMLAIDESVCKEWETRPGVLSWDIECYSDNPLAMPNKLHHKHEAYMISAIYKQYKNHESIKRYGIIIGNCDQIPKEKLSNCTIIQTEDECSMVEAFGRIIIETDPEILIGYNIFSFDYPYLDHRIKRQCFSWPKMSRLIGEVPKIPEGKAWHSNAYGHTDNHILGMSGRISIDLLPVVKRDYNMDTYTLNAVCLKFIQKEKNDVSPKQMFLYYEEMQAATKGYKLNPNDDTKKELERAIKNTTEVMEYCIKDSELVLELMEALDIWVGLVELSNIVGVTIVDIFTKGQQVRCVSQLYNLATSMGVVINKKLNETYHYKGGKVQDPIAGLHENIICLDFRSLYPSIIDAYNICYSTLVAKEHMDYVPDSECNVFEFDQEEETEDNGGKDDKDERNEDEDPIVFKKRKKKVIVTKNVHYKFKFYKNKVGLLPTLVRNLVNQRNAVRNIQKEEKNPHMKMVLEKRQLALKVSANSFYGFLGVREGGKLPCIEAAMCVTARGRELITFVSDHLVEKYNASVIYGDTDCTRGSVPILVRFENGTIDYIQIKDLINYGTEMEQKQYRMDKLDQVKDQKFYMKDINMEVWSDNGWTKIVYLMRHRVNKQSYRINTHTGVVDVTEDHSLLNERGVEVTPNEVRKGMNLLHRNLPNVQIVNNITVEKAWMWGFFMAEGTCGHYTSKWGIKNTWSLSNVDLEYLTLAQQYMAILEPDYNFVIDNTIESSGAYKLSVRGHDLADIIERYENLFYTERSDHNTKHTEEDLGERSKKVPSEILMANNTIKEAFLKGWYAGDGEMDGLISEPIKLLRKTNILPLIIKRVKTAEEIKKKIKTNDMLFTFVNLDNLINNILDSVEYDNINLHIYDMIQEEDTKTQFTNSCFFVQSPCSLNANFSDIEKYKLMKKRLINAINHELMNKHAHQLIRLTGIQRNMYIDNVIINLLGNLINPIINQANYTISLICAFIINLIKLIKSEKNIEHLIHTHISEYIGYIKIYLMNDCEIEKYNIKKVLINPNTRTYVRGRFDIKDQIGAAGLYMVCSALGYSISIANTKRDIYRLLFTRNKQTMNANVIKNKIDLGILDEDVFDIETENHHFAAGPGRMIVHNSVMVDLHIKDSKQCQYWGELLAQEISGVKAGDFLPGSKTEKHLVDVPGLFPSPLGTEFEKAMRLFCIKKKKYAAYLISKDGSFKKKVLKDANGIVVKELDELEMLKKGIVLARRDNNALLKDVYLRILNLIMDGGTFKQAFIILMDTIIQLKDNKVDHMLLKSSRALGAHYKSESNFMHIFANELRKIGKLVNPGDRLEFLVIEKPGNPLVGYKMVLLCDYVDSLKTPEPMKLDYIHYIQKVLKNPIDQLFEIGFGVYLNRFKNITYTPTRKRNPIYLTNPCKMAFHMMENGLDVVKFKNTVLNYINYVDNPIQLNVI